LLYLLSEEFFGNIMRTLLIYTINVFVFMCIFDPSDIVFKLKVPLFCLCWFLLILYKLAQKSNEAISIKLLLFIMAFTILPLLSINWYTFTNNSEPYDGYQYFKSYLFISFAIILYELKLDYLRNISLMLSILSCCILCVYIAVIVNPSLLLPISYFGHTSGLISISNRDYGSGVQRLSAFFVTSPMLAISIAYFTNLAINSKDKYKHIYKVIALINIIAMFMAGTRNNMLVSLCLPLTIYLYCSNRKKLVFSIIILFLTSLALYYHESISVMLSPGEISNETKIGYLPDYIDIFSNPLKLLLGEGLGSYHYWSNKGSEVSITELTYFELIRSYGIILAPVVLVLILYPILRSLQNNKLTAIVPVIIGYAFYLFMCFSNPFIFSSLGMLILSILISNIFLIETKYNKSIYYEREY
jgi:hypothetical protein